MPDLNPLDPALLPRLDKQYTAFYNANLVNVPMIHQLPWDPSLHSMKSVAGAAPPLPVASTRDVDLGAFRIRIFYPDTPNPPVFIWFHGGGMVLGSLDAENAFCTRIVRAAGCAVVAVDYRLAPENPFPAGSDDAWTTLKYLTEHGAELGLDASRIGIGGFSSGGNLAAAASHRAGREGLPLSFVVLSVPVTDNTATPDSAPSWGDNRNCPGLNDEKMLWYRDQYFPNLSDRANPTASPLLAPDEWIAASPNDVYVVLAGLDLLFSEGRAYAERLKRAGKEVEVVVFEELPHLAMAMDGVLDRAREWNTGICNYVARRFGRPEMALEELYPAEG